MKTKAIQGILFLGILVSGLSRSEAHSLPSLFRDGEGDILLRNAYINRDYNDKQDKSEWGQGVIATFKSGFTPGKIGLGFDYIAQYAVRLDGGRGKSGAGGIDFFEQDKNGQARKQLAKFGIAAKLHFSDTVISYGIQRPELPILSADDTRLLDETYTGAMLMSKEIEGMDIHIGYLTAESPKSSDSHNSGLKSIILGGIHYNINPYINTDFYASNVKGVLSKQYFNINYKPFLNEKSSLAFDFNGYNSRLNNQYAQRINTGRHNTIWSLAANYTYGVHNIMLAYQSNSGDTGYHYGGYQNRGGVGDGGGTVWLPNSYWSDFNGEDEHSWQAAYIVDLSKWGTPGLEYKAAYIQGDNIKTQYGNNDGYEREIFNQLKYRIASGIGRGFTFKVRYSILHVSSNAKNYNSGGKEIRVFIEYPL